MKQKRSKLKDIAIETKIKHTGKKKKGLAKTWPEHQWAVGQPPAAKIHVLDV